MDKQGNVMTAEEWLNDNELSVNIFNKKYRNNGESLEEFFERVGHGYSPIIELIKEKKFLFGGRILANRGVSGRNVSLSNCYVLPRPEDNLESIFDIASKMARTFSYGGKITALPPYIVIYRKKFSEPIHIGCVLFNMLTVDTF